MGYITTFLHSQLFVRLPYPDYDFSGQTIIVTGSNTGLGLEAARHFIRLNAAKVILAVRTISKGEAAAAQISASTNTPKSQVEVWQLDLSHADSIKAFAARVDTLDRLDAFVQNAGILTNIFTLVEGQESHIAINVTNAVLLGLLVLPKLRESAARYGSRGRLTFVGSDLQYIAKFKEKIAAGKEAGVSLYDALASKELADMDDRYVDFLSLLWIQHPLQVLLPVRTDHSTSFSDTKFQNYFCFMPSAALPPKVLYHPDPT